MATSSDINYEGSFLIKGKSCNVVLTPADIQWKLVKKEETVVIPLSEVISSRVDRSEKGSCWVLSYVARKKKHVLKKAVVTFTGQEDQCTGMVTRIQEGVKNLPDRPKSILVFVNPISGSKKGRQVFERKVRPVLEEAGIKLDVCITERAHHTQDVLSSYNLSSVDSILAVGGDGIYHEVANGLFQRQCKDAGINVNDPSVDLPPLNHRIGLIPCGTGNGIAFQTYGNYEVETAVLAIIVGRSNINNILAVYCERALLAFSILLLGYGWWSDLIYVTESRRSMGVWRYPISMAEAFFKSYRQMTVCLDYVPPVEPGTSSTAGTEQTSDKGQDTGADSQLVTVQVSDDTSKAEDKTVSELSAQPMIEQQTGNPWKRIEGVVIALSSFGQMDVAFPVDGIPRTDCAPVSVLKPCSRIEFLSLLKNMIMFSDSFARHEKLVGGRMTEYRFKLTDELASPESDLGRKQRSLNIDGEYFQLKSPEIHAKLHMQKFSLFANVPIDWVVRERR